MFKVCVKISWLLRRKEGPFISLLAAASYLTFYNVRYFLSHPPLLLFRSESLFCLLPHYASNIFFLELFSSLYGFSLFISFLFSWCSFFFFGPSIPKSRESSILNAHVPTTPRQQSQCVRDVIPSVPSSAPFSYGAPARYPVISPVNTSLDISAWWGIFF